MFFIHKHCLTLSIKLYILNVSNYTYMYRCIFLNHFHCHLRPLYKSYLRSFSVFEILRARKSTDLRASSLGIRSPSECGESTRAKPVAGKRGKHGKPTATTANATVSVDILLRPPQSRALDEEVTARPSFEVERLS